MRWRPSTVQTIKMGADADGRLVAIKHHAIEATSTYEDYQKPSSTGRALPTNATMSP